jgi:hypothetical protein
MRQKTQKHQNQGSIDKKIRFFAVPMSHTQMGSLSAKNAIKKFACLGTFNNPIIGKCCLFLAGNLAIWNPWNMPHLKYRVVLYSLLILMFLISSTKKTVLRIHQGPYTEWIDLWFEPFFVKEIRLVIEWLREIKTADQHCYKFLLIQQNNFFTLNVN